MFLKNLMESYNLANKDLAVILKCTEKRVGKLLNLDAEISTTDMLRVCEHLKLWSDNNLSSLFGQAVADNEEYRRRHSKKTRERYDSK